MIITEAELSTKEQEHLATVKELRLQNFSRNLPFLMLSHELPEGQIYREFPDGRIEVQEVFVAGSEYKSKAIRVLKPHEADQVRKEYGLF